MFLIAGGQVLEHRLILGSKEYDFSRHHVDPATAAVQGVAHVVTTSFQGVAQLFYSPVSFCAGQFVDGRLKVSLASLGASNMVSRSIVIVT